MIDIIITSYNEPKSTLRAVESILKQNVKDEYRITIVDPFVEVRNFLKKEVKDKRVRFMLDSGEGKSYILNLLLQEYASSNKDDLFIFTDGDVYISENAINEILDAFKDKEIGCVTGKPVSLDSKETKYGYWQGVAFDGINKVREMLAKEKKFFECSGYLFAIRKGVIFDFPLETSEDSIIPYLFWKKGFKIGYANKSEVYVKNPDNWHDWITQKVRNVKAHENLNKIAPEMPRTKTFWNEIKYGALFTLLQPRSLRQIIWTIELYFARLYLYIRAFKELRKKDHYKDGWRENSIESTKTLD